MDTGNKPPGTAAGADKESFGLVVLLPPMDGDSGWTLMLTDANSPIEVFEAAQHSGNGYAWDSVARVLMKPLSAAQRESVAFDSEAGTFVALSDDADVLRALGRAIDAVLRDHAALRAAIDAVPEDDWDD